MANRKVESVSFLILSLFIINIFGCATLKEKMKGLAGVSTKILEDNRYDAISKNFDFDYAGAYKRVKEALSSMGTYVYSEDKKNDLIAVYISETDTTVVGIFLTEIEGSKVKVEVSSPSTYGKETISKRLFAILEGLPDPALRME
ncbi:MAG: hypothetical protein JW788_05740 [Candidatus Omnitrophica bacterium]|nr:hypothetical protein [Candidatus Omnitrophota bacterium]